jgi:hypothetical protein
MAGPAFSTEESLIVYRGFHDGLGPAAITALLHNRTKNSVRSHLRSMGLYDVPVQEPKPYEPEVQQPVQHDTVRERVLRSDYAFKKAMLAALHSGLEHAPIGVFKDRSALISARFYREPTLSGCGSAAAMCESFAGSEKRAVASTFI